MTTNQSGDADVPGDVADATGSGDVVWDALGDKSRRAIVLRLAERPRAVVELAESLPLSRPAVSQHLKVLKDAGLVAETPVGTRRIYRLNAAGLTALRDQLDTFWNRALSGFQDLTAHPDQPEETP
ncbi:MAG TPA: metalloregulator ArsR/SmtB family transcription factor [Acidimicrobiales bacterium]